MTTAVDTSVLLDVFTASPQHVAASQNVAVPRSGIQPTLVRGPGARRARVAAVARYPTRESPGWAPVRSGATASPTGSDSLPEHPGAEGLDLRDEPLQDDREPLL